MLPVHKSFMKNLLSVKSSEESSDFFQVFIAHISVFISFERIDYFTFLYYFRFENYHRFRFRNLFNY